MSKEAIIELEYLPVDALTPYENNTRAHGDTDVDAICESISQFGFSDPIGVWGAENVIVEGHGRLTAAKRLGLDTVPVIHLDHLTDEQRRAYAIAHNKTAELSKWDFEKLDLEMASLKQIDFVALGFAPISNVEGGGAA
ncbi:ParB N-terminal domain-containing protein [Candidatus Saccharibacteria bacterium]|nr:ParB N-terminal domain-containing protein [Candidatus Saccharibacteria bacterium]